MRVNVYHCGTLGGCAAWEHYKRIGRLEIVEATGEPGGVHVELDPETSPLRQLIVYLPNLTAVLIEPDTAEES